MFNARTLVLIGLVAMVTGQASLKGRINQRGVDFLMNIAEDYSLGFQMNGLRFVEKIFFLQLINNVSSLVVTHFDVQQVVMDQDKAATDTYIMDMSKSSLGFSAQYDIEFNNFRDQTSNISDGTVFFLYPNVGVHVVVQFNNDQGKELSFSLLECRASIEGLSENVNPSALDMPESLKKNLKHFIDTGLALHVEKEICTSVLSQILLPTINNFISGIPDGFATFAGISVNVSLYDSPKVKNHSLEVELDGRGYPANNSDISYSYVRYPLPEFEQSSIMVQIAAGQYFAETLLHSAIAVGLLKFDLDFESLDFGGTSLNPQLFENIIPNFDRFFNGRPLGLHIELVDPPVINVGPSQINATGFVIISMVAMTYNRTFTQDPSDTAISLNVSVDVSGNIGIRGNNITGELTKLKLFFYLKSKNESIGTPNLFLLNFIIDPLAKEVLLPLVNGMLEPGFEIPELLGFKLENATLDLVEHAGILSTDIARVPEDSSGSGSERNYESLV